MKAIRFPRKLQKRLNELLDRQDVEGKLSAKERREAQALEDLVDALSLLNLKVKRLQALK